MEATLHSQKGACVFSSNPGSARWHTASSHRLYGVHCHMSFGCLQQTPGGFDGTQHLWVTLLGESLRHHTLTFLEGGNESAPA